MGGRPAKHLSLVTGHLTKEEKATREKSEGELAAKAKMKKSAEVQKNKVASAHFNRLKALYGEINICDGLCENAINRYCLMLARLQELSGLSDAVREAMQDLRERRGEMEALECVEALNKMTQNLIGIERSSAKIRDQLLAIERENLLTIQGKLRAVPKKPEKEKAKSGLAAYREKYGG